MEVLNACVNIYALEYQGMYLCEQFSLKPLKVDGIQISLFDIPYK
jgi:hypothetical protein